MKAVDSHGDCLEPFFDVVPLSIVELAAQVVSREGSQIATSIHEEFCVSDVVFLGESVQKRHRGVSPAAAKHVHFEQELRFCVDGGLEPLFFAIDFDLFLVDRDPRRRCRRRVALRLSKCLFPVPDRLMTAIDTQPA